MTANVAEISEKIVRELPAPATGNRITYFPGARLQGLVAPAGFGVRVTANGRRAFVMNYRVNGLERRYTIGEHGTWSVIAALREGRDLRKRIDKGDDPLAQRTEKRDAATLKELCQQFLEQHVADLRGSTQRDYKALIAIIQAELGGQKLEAVHRANIAALHRSRKTTPYRANRLLAVASALFNFAVREKLCVENPCKGIKRFPEDPRERYLSPEELARLTEALANYPDALVGAITYGEDAERAREKARAAGQKAADLVRLCLLTGCRRGEAMSAAWTQFDFNRATWTKPSAHTKQARQHVANLSDAAIILLKAIQDAAPKGEDGELESPYVFPGDTPNQSLSTIRDHWHAIRKAAKLQDFRLHDARHNYASLLASAGASLPMVGRLLGHTQAQTTARYIHLFDDPLKKVADVAGDIVTGKPSAKIEPIRRGGAA